MPHRLHWLQFSEHTTISSYCRMNIPASFMHGIMEKTNWGHESVSVLNHMWASF